MRREYARETLAEADIDADPVVQFDERGFCFYTNYESRKAAELAANPRAALVFWWDALERQVRIEGRVEPTSRAESEAYFASRPPGSQLSAAASPQSRVIDRATLERRVAELATSLPDGQVPLPDFWGGYRLTPEVVEFWQGRPSRLHDRLRYRRAGDAWVIERLAP
jgi:pyridoxamine 5'-phosphate oxidase